MRSWVENDDKKTMTDEELAAKVIVQMTLFIATQVLTLAYLSIASASVSYTHLTLPTILRV